MEKEKKVLHCHLGIHGAPPAFYRIALHYFPAVTMAVKKEKLALAKSAHKGRNKHFWYST